MSYRPPHLEKIYVHRDSWGSDLHRRFQLFYDQSLFEEVDEEPLQSKEPMSAEDFDRSKRVLLLTPFRGQFFKRCPGATQKKALACCNYHVLNLGQQCNFNCSYCYLQSYINSRTMKLYTNIDSALTELREMAEEHGALPFRVGTGEVIDSLSMDPITLFSRKLVGFFRDYPKWTLEFKTKSAEVEQFLDEPHAGNVVVSWSINPTWVVQTEEHGTAPLHERLKAARRCLDRGFQIAFHIDPMIYFEGWQKHYRELTEQILSQFRPEEVNVISVGTLRYQPEQRQMMKERFGLASRVLQGEMFPSESGKMRYPQHLREEMFKFLVGQFRQSAQGSQWRIFFCMETPETWISAYEDTPMKVPGLRDLFRPLPKVEG